jgi:hypothetical protein
MTLPTEIPQTDSRRPTPWLSAGCHVLPQVALFSISSAAAHALEDAVDSSMSRGTIGFTTDSRLSVSEGAASSDSQSHKPVTIILHDSATGKDTPWQCVSASDRPPADELMVDANSLTDVAAALCAPN